MKVAILGGTGFVGSYILDELVGHGHLPQVLVRPSSIDRVRHLDACKLNPGSVEDAAAVARATAGSDAVIYNIGTLKESPRKGITFEELHFDGARRAIDAAVEAGSKRFLLMSANGVRAGGTAFEDTKFKAEQYLQSSGLDWTIFRPSVLFGDPRGRMEFATQLYNDMVSSFVPAPLFYDGFLPLAAGSMQMSPIHVRDVARIFVASLERDDSVGRILHLGGAQSLSWKRILQIIGEATNKRVIGIPTPAWAVKTVAGWLEGLDIMPVTKDQLSMLMEGNTCDSREIFHDYGIVPIPFDAANLAYLKATRSAGSADGASSALTASRQ